MQEAEIELLKQTFSGLMYVGDIPGFVKNMGTTISGMTAQYWKSFVVGFDNRLVSRGHPHNGRLPEASFCGIKIT